MTNHSTPGDFPKDRDGGLGLLAVVGLILISTFWTVESFVESGTPVAAALRSDAQLLSPGMNPVASPATDCPDCDAQTLSPASDGVQTAPAVLLRAASACQLDTATGRRADGSSLPWSQVGAPLPDDVNG